MSVTEPLFQHLKEIETRIHRSQKLFLLLDFDGTLAPIVSDPALAELPRETRQVLRALQNAGAILAIISGRSLDDVRARVKLDAIYAGNHGLEIEGPGVHFREHSAEALQPELATLCRRLLGDLSHIPGIIIEYKGLSASVHYRNAPAESVPEVAAIVDRALEAAGSPFVMHTGKKVFEIRPCVHWHKGSAVRWLRQRIGPAGALPVCIGDDATDEDAFRALPDGVTICVGSAVTRARYRARDRGEALAFLEWLAAQISTPPAPSPRHTETSRHPHTVLPSAGHPVREPENCTAA